MLNFRAYPNLPEQVAVQPISDTPPPVSAHQLPGIQAGPPSSTSFVAPPAEVLWAWLSYIYQTTGEWLMPPGSIPTAATKPVPDTQAQAPNLETPPLLASSSTSTPLEVNTTSMPKNSNQVNPTSSGISYQLPIPTMIPFAPVASSNEVKTRTITRSPVVVAPNSVIAGTSNFNYATSIYFQEAGRLVEHFAQKPIAPEQNFGVKLVLSLVIAWCMTPLFYERDGWMTLAFERGARELKLRAEVFKSHLNALQTAGLIKFGPVSSGIINRQEFEQLRYDCATLGQEFGCGENGIWKPRTLQEKTIIYRLAIQPELRPDLPVFKPFPTNSPSMRNDLPKAELSGEPPQKSFYTSEGRWEQTQPPRKDVTLPITFPERPATDLESTIKSFPVLPYHGIVHEINDNEDVAPSNLTSEQTMIYNFLNQEASFAGFSRPDGRKTLDSREVIKFAQNPALTLEIAQERYQQVNQMWVNGECRKNPLGLLHWALSRACELRTEDENIVSSKSQPTFNRKSAQAKSYPRQKATRKPSGWEKVVTNTSEVVGSNVSDTPDLLPYNQNQETHITKVLPGASSLNNLSEIWEELRSEDLVRRFRLTQEEITLLEGSHLHLNDSVENSRSVVIVLRSALENQILNRMARSTIGLALRQRLGPGYKIIFTSREYFEEQAESL